MNLREAKALNPPGDPPGHGCLHAPLGRRGRHAHSGPARRTPRPFPGLQEARSSIAPGPAHTAQPELPSLTRHGATRPLRPPPPTVPALLTLPRPWRSRWVRSPPGFLLQIQTQAAPVSGAGRSGAPARPAPAAMPRGPGGSRPAGPRRHC